MVYTFLCWINIACLLELLELKEEWRKAKEKSRRKKQKRDLGSRKEEWHEWERKKNGQLSSIEGSEEGCSPSDSNLSETLLQEKKTLKVTEPERNRNTGKHGGMDGEMLKNKSPRDKRKGSQETRKSRKGKNRDSAQKEEYKTDITRVSVENSTVEEKEKEEKEQEEEEKEQEEEEQGFSSTEVEAAIALSKQQSVTSIDLCFHLVLYSPVLFDGISSYQHMTSFIFT